MNRNKGITLVSLVITIIVMLILAGVSLNFVAGENSVLSKAELAVKETEKARIIEELQSMMLGYNMKVGTKESVTDYVRSKLGSTIDGIHVLSRDGDPFYVIEKDGFYFYIEQIGREYIVELMDTSLDDIRAGYTIVTEQIMKSKENWNMQFDLAEGEKSTIIFFDKITNEFSFEINGGTVNIHFTEDMNLTNEGKNRSAIKIASGATLNMYLSEGITVTVNSGYGVDGTEANNVLGAEGGPGGYAGINVPYGANLHVYGGGTLIAYGGDAGDGGGSVSDNRGGGGGGGAGAGIGGNGGKGGDAGSTFTRGDGSSSLLSIRQNGQTLGNSGKDGGHGQDCGNIYFHGTTTVYAYGGAGGSGGSKNTTNNSGAGGGGYPAAGIGGGGAGGGGGDHACPSGGYSAGSGEGSVTAGVNGRASGMTSVNWMITAGGYYKMGLAARPAEVTTKAYFNQGGMWSSVGGEYCFFMDHSGSGGYAGAGGNVYYSDPAKIFAYNGDMITNGDYTQAYDYDINGNEGLVMSPINKMGTTKNIVPAKIFAQTGYIRPVYKTNQHMSDEEAASWHVDPCTQQNGVRNVKIIPESTTAVTGYSNGYRPNQGIGSGAGYLEKSNGIFAKITN